MNKDQRKQVVANYMEQERVIGVYQITNKVTGRKFIGSTSNMDGAWGRETFELGFGAHKNKDLQSDWNELGSDSFVFEVLDKLKLEEKIKYDYKDVLTPDAPEGQPAQRLRQYRKSVAELEKQWIEQLRNEGVDCYNISKEG